MDCPDCKVPMIWNGEMMGKDGAIIMREKLLWKCPKCRLEIEEDDSNE